MFEANVPDKFGHLLYPKAILLSAMLDLLTIINVEGKDKSCYEHDRLSTPKWTSDMKVFGEAGVVKLKTKLSWKINNNMGKMCVFVTH